MKIKLILLLAINFIINCAHYETSAHYNLNAYMQVYAIHESNGKSWYPFLKLAMTDFINAAFDYKKLDDQKDKLNAILEIIILHKTNLEDVDRNLIDQQLETLKQ